MEYLFQQGEISKGVFRMGSHLKIMDSCGVQGIEADLLDHHTLHEAMEGVDVIYYMASPMPDADSDFIKVNTEGVLNVLEAATEVKAKAFVYLSALDVYGFVSRTVTPSSPFSPSTEYQKSKAEAERILQEFAKRNGQPRIAILRPAKAVGPRDESLVVPILRMVASGKGTLPSSGRMSFSHPKDIAQAMYRATTWNSLSGAAVLVKSFDATLVELATQIATAMGKPFEAGRSGFLARSPLSRYTTEQMKASIRIDEQPGWKDLGFAPTYTLKSTCEEIARWYEKETWVAEDA